ncbi:MAG: type I glyceraldehyde-3-phosphate dehydrogenase [Patescibacteria group bacterium]|nr:type I glyceraldehyde-3-phosphate dehydrogenase [Patescibacteria group bacterium]
MTRIAINGFGRIGRNTLKAGLHKAGFKVVGINDLTDTATLAHLLEHDTAYGHYKEKINFTKSSISVAGKKIPVFAEKDPTKLPWKKLKVDVVLECTGRFRDLESASMHLTAGAKSVIISAPAKGDGVPTHVIGLNEKHVKKNVHVINNASCTTNCIAPAMQVLMEEFGIKKAGMTTVHAYTADQNIQDGPHKDLRRARAAAQNIVPTTTGAAVATTQVVDGLNNKFDGIAIRVPVVVGSLTDITALLKRRVTVAQVNNAFIKAAKEKRWKDILTVTDEPIVSSDIIGNPHSSIVDLSMTKVIDGDLVKVLTWYDNEWGYSHRLAEMALKLGKTI